MATSEPLLAEKSHRLSLELGNERFWVDGDRVRLARVVSNLLNHSSLNQFSIHSWLTRSY